MIEILRLPRPFQAPPRAELPPYDAAGFPHGLHYRPFLRARTIRHSTRATVRGLLYQRRHELLSWHEYRIFMALCFSPYVIDVREQYPMFDSERYWRASSAGRRMRTVDVPSMDFLVTYWRADRCSYAYHGISVKPPGHVEDIRRKQRDESYLGGYGWTRELLLGSQVSKIEAANYGVLESWVRRSNVGNLYIASREFAGWLASASRRAPLSSVLSRISKRRSIDFDDAYRYLAAGVRYGFLELDQTRSINPDLPIFLKGDEPPKRIYVDDIFPY